MEKRTTLAFAQMKRAIKLTCRCCQKIAIRHINDHVLPFAAGVLLRGRVLEHGFKRVYLRAAHLRHRGRLVPGKDYFR